MLPVGHSGLCIALLSYSCLRAIETSLNCSHSPSLRKRVLKQATRTHPRKHVRLCLLLRPQPGSSSPSIPHTSACQHEFDLECKQQRGHALSTRIKHID